MKDKIFHDRSARAIELFEDMSQPGKTLSDTTMRSIMQALVWPAMSRFSRFDTRMKHANYEDFVRLCSAVAKIQARYDESQPQVKQISAR